METSSLSGFAGKTWEVHKFGGTSVASADCYLRVASIIENQLGIQSQRWDDNGESSLRSGDDATDCYDPNNRLRSDKNLGIVVSAMGGKPKVTDLLLSAVKAAAERDEILVNALLDQVSKKHFSCIESLSREASDIGETTADCEILSHRLKKVIESDLSNVRDILKTVSLMKWQAERISQVVSGFGELWSAQILAALLRARANVRDRRMQSSLPPSSNVHHFSYLDARQVIIVDEDIIKDGAICWQRSSEALKNEHQAELSKLVTPNDTSSQNHLHLVMTGYIASNIHGVPTTLKRDGSDYSASILGRLLKATQLTIWTDVDGVLSADPRRVPNAQVLPQVSYNEAMELAYFGATVLHPKTIQPALMSEPQIPIYIRNTFNSSFPGSKIYTSSFTKTDNDQCVCGFSSIDHMALVNLEGSGIVGVPGVAKRLFGTLDSIGVNVVLISQASSEHSITFATLTTQAGTAKCAIEEEFRRELSQQHMSEVSVQTPCSIVAAVGDGMHSTTGVAGRFFTALGDAKINVLAISQGCSERNISVVVATNESTRALRALHAAFRLSHTVVKVGVVGMNEIGISLVALLEAQREKIRTSFEIDLQVCAIATDGTSKDLVTLKREGSDESITVSAYKVLTAGADPSLTFGETGVPASPDLINSDVGMATILSQGVSSLVDHVKSEDWAHTVIFDCTAEEVGGELHAEWLNAGIHVVTANSTGLAGSEETRAAIFEAEERRTRGKFSAEYLREVTVAGGLPVISTLRDLLNSGDKIRFIDGILSVAMSYILFRIAPPRGVSACSDFDKKSSAGAFKGHMLKTDAPCSVSKAVEEAISLGLMEVDPWKDLSNEYTARMLMVLAHELRVNSGNTVASIQHESDKLTKNAKDNRVNPQLLPPGLDQQMKERVAQAAMNGCVPRHISSINVKTGTINVKLVDVPSDHIFATTPPSCACVRFFTERHRQYPLIVQGPSAGADSTASALLAELLHLMRSKVGPRSGALTRTGSSAFLA